MAASMAILELERGTGLPPFSISIGTWGEWGGQKGEEELLVWCRHSIHWGHNHILTRHTLRMT